MSQDIIYKIKDILTKDIKPHLEADGGGVEFVDFDEKTGVLQVHLAGACAGCPMKEVTLQSGIGSAIKREIPEVKEVVAV